jgi:hypothetical protein
MYCPSVREYRATVLCSFCGNVLMYCGLCDVTGVIIGGTNRNKEGRRSREERFNEIKFLLICRVVISAAGAPRRGQQRTQETFLFSEMSGESLGPIKCPVEWVPRCFLGDKAAGARS